MAEVKPRDVLNGIEDPQWSYWGGNILQGEDGTFHLFVCRWREDHPKGHMAWHESEVVRAVSRNRLGPYKVAEVLGPGHNPEAYRLKDGRYVCYVINAYYLGATPEGPWEKKQFEFDPRDRKIVANLSNLSFMQREDGSYLMVNRGGGMWVSRDGLATWEPVTQQQLSQSQRPLRRSGAMANGGPVPHDRQRLVRPHRNPWGQNPWGQAGGRD